MSAQILYDSVVPITRSEPPAPEPRSLGPTMRTTTQHPLGAPAFAVVVPVYNEEESLRPLLVEIETALAGFKPYEVIFIDDGSGDGSADVLTELAQQRPHVRVLRRPANAGQSAALAAGFRAVRAPLVVTLDGDLQNDPADIPLLLAAIEDCDVVSGIRLRRQDTVLRRLASRIANRVRRWVVGDSILDVGCSLKAYRTALLREVPMFNGVHRFLPGLLEMRGARVMQVEVQHRARRYGRSKYGIHNRLWRGLADLAGARWLRSRWIDTAPVEELTPCKPPFSGSFSDSSARASSSHVSSSSGSLRSAAGAASSRRRFGS